MTGHVLFIQGGGDGGYEADTKLVASLCEALGETYSVYYPRMFIEDKPDFGWCQQIGDEIVGIKKDVILVGHSLGASLLMKYLSENEMKNRIVGVFLISTPFWSGGEEWVQGLKLDEAFGNRLPQDVPIFFYHCHDDEVVSFDQFLLYRQKLPWATFREINSGGHQLNNDLTPVAMDIKELCKS